MRNNNKNNKENITDRGDREQVYKGKSVKVAAKENLK